MEETKPLKILDCSLRDGGYYTNWDFNNLFVEEYLKRLNQLPVDYIEIGYRSKPLPGYAGAFFYCPDYLLKKIGSISSKKLAIILNEKDVEIHDLDDLLRPCQGIIRLIRIAVAPEKLQSSLGLVEKIKAMGFEVSLNVMYLSTWDLQDSFLNSIKEFDDILDYFYLVDSYGGVLPDKLKELVGFVKSETNLKLGFHAHNNLELALSNTLTAIACGVDIVDATVLGMGRGAGNLKTELLLTTLQSQGKLEVDYDELSKAVNLFSPLQEKYQWGTNLAYMVSGSNSLPQKEVMAQIGKRFYSLNSIVRGIHNRSKGLEDNLNLQELTLNDSFHSAIIVGGGSTGTTHCEAVRYFLETQPDSCLIHASSKNAGAYKDINQQQFHCLVGNEGHRLEKVYEHLEQSNKIAVLPPYPRAMGTYIPKALQDKAFQLKEITFTIAHVESVTALAIETALKMKVQQIYFIGYDGYEDGISTPEMELFKENEAIFEILDQKGINACALTPTKYSRLKQDSVFSYI